MGKPAVEYRPVFDIMQVGFQWWIPFIGVMAASLLSFIGWALRRAGDKDTVWKGTLFQLLGTASGIIALGFGASMYVTYHRAIRALTEHNYLVAEGVVHEFVPMPPGGHAVERFSVGGVHFQCGAGWGSATFNSEWNKGFIRNGVQARIMYSGADILKVEVR